MILLYVPCKDEHQAETIAHTLLQKKVIVCTNIWPITSMYLWEGKIEKGTEYVLLVKTDKKSVDRAEEIIKEMHSYDIPAIIHINIDVNKEFREWAKRILIK